MFSDTTSDTTATTAPDATTSRWQLRALLIAMVTLGVLGAAAMPAQAQSVPIQIQKLLADDGATGDSFGTSVSMSGNHAIVGVPNDDDEGTNSGSAYVFERQPNGTWSQAAKLTAAERSFARSVSISGDRALVGAPEDTDNGLITGSAYVFQRQPSGTWSQAAKLTAADGAEGDQFGTSVSLSGDRALVGAPFEAGGFGSAYVFDLQPDGSTWNEAAKLTDPDGVRNDLFGISVSLNGDRALVGTLFGDSDVDSTTGSAYVFERQPNGTWPRAAKLTAADGFAGHQFGRSVSLSGDRALVGAPEDTDNGLITSSAYVFEQQSNGTWSQAAKLTAADGALDDGFGRSVSLSGDRALVGAYRDDDQGTNSGSAYVFERQPSGTWSQAAKLTATGGAEGDEFGTSVSISGGRAIVGAPDDDDKGVRSGSAYLFGDPALTLHVDASGGSDSNTGQSWNEAFATLQKALSVATGNDQIWIAAGTYVPGSDRSDSFRVTGAQDGLKIYGGFAGSETSPGQRQPGSETILSGDIDGNGTLSGNSYHVLVFDGGDRIGPDVVANVTAATLLDGVTVTGGNANSGSIPNDSGGGLYCDGQGSGNVCSPTLTGVTFTGNTANSGGGAIYNDGSFRGTSSPQITNAVVTDNSAARFGGAIFNSGETDGESSPQITNATFTGNSASSRGGAIYNSGRRGGTSSPQITNATFTGNSASSRGGAIYNDGDFEGASAPQVTNAILWGNGSDEIYNVDATPTLKHTLIEGGLPSGSTDGGSNLNADPLFTNASDPAGPDGIFGTSDDGLRLQSGSPAIDAGDDAAVPSGVTTDLAGADRVQGGAVDLGAYETVLAPVACTASNFTEIFNDPARRVEITINDPEGIATISFTDLDGMAYLNNLNVELVEATGSGGSVGFSRDVADDDINWSADDSSGLPTTVVMYLNQADTSIPEASYFMVIGNGCGTDTVIDPPVTFTAFDASTAAFGLDSAYPNPSSGPVTLNFSLAEAAPVTLAIYDVMGRRVATLVDQAMAAGAHTVDWTGRSGGGPLASGLYLLRLQAGDEVATRRLTVVR